MKSILTLLGVSVLLVSCQATADEPYQNFKSSDYEFIPEHNQDIHKVITFRNAQNEIVRIKPTTYNLEKAFVSGIAFSQPTQTASYYYDDLWIGLELLDVDVSNQVGGGCNQTPIHIHKVGDGSILTKMIIPF